MRKMVKKHEEGSSFDDMWPMGAVTRRTGITEHTLRAWERRFGFPDPERLPSGHRRYPVDQVRRLLLISKALESGYRAGDVVPMNPDRLDALLRESQPDQGRETDSERNAFLQKLVAAAAEFDRDRIADLLAGDASRLGVPRFLRERAVPLLTAVGDAWAKGELHARHEHLVSDILEDQLRTLRHALDVRSSSSPVILATLPEERHSLGLHLVATEIASAGCDYRFLGPQLPVGEIAAAADFLKASAVGLSVSIFADTEVARAGVLELRELLPSSIELWLGGAGAAKLEDLDDDVKILSTLDDVANRVRRLET